METTTIQNWPEIMLTSLKSFGEKLFSVLPNIIGALLFLLAGLLIAKIVSLIIVKGLRLAHFDDLKEKFASNELLSASNIQIEPTKIVGKFVYWTILLLFFILASDILGWEAVSRELGNIVRYLPKLFSGLVIFGIGIFIANFIRKAIITFTAAFGVATGKFLANTAYYVILVFLAITALNQIGIDTSILNSNITIILGASLLSFALSFGLASKDLLQNVLSGIYSKNNFSTGQKIKVNGITGEILKIDNISILLGTDKGRTVIPLKDLINQQVEILD